MTHLWELCDAGSDWFWYCSNCGCRWRQPQAMPPCAPQSDIDSYAIVSPFSGSDTVELLEKAERDHFQRLSTQQQELSGETPEHPHIYTFDEHKGWVCMTCGGELQHKHAYVWDAQRGWVCSLCGEKESS